MMEMTPFRRGLILGASLPLLGVIGAFTIAATSQAEGEPQPVATREDVRGRILSREGPTICVSSDQTGVADGGTQAVEVCGKDYEGSVPPTITVGDAVVGSVVHVEVDPGSGSHWSLWLGMGAPVPG